MDLNDSENVHLKLQHDMLSPIKVTPIESTQTQEVQNRSMVHTMEVRSLSFNRITKVTISNCKLFQYNDNTIMKRITCRLNQ